MWARLHGQKFEGSEELREGRNQGKRCVAKNELQFSSWLVFAILIFHPPIPIYLLTVPPGQNDTQSPCYHHHLVSKREPEVVLFIATPTTTSLASNRELEVVLFGSFDTTPTTEGYEGGGGARGDNDLLIVIPLINDPPSIVRGFLL